VATLLGGRVLAFPAGAMNDADALGPLSQGRSGDIHRVGREGPDGGYTNVLASASGSSLPAMWSAASSRNALALSSS
jgi:hypothetical protein